MSPVLRRAAAADLEALMRLERAFPGDRLSRRSLRRLLASARAEVWVADGETGAIGNAVVLYRRRSWRARLYSLVVAPAARGRGTGAGLLEASARAAAVRGCERLALEVRRDNAAAIALYLRHGFRAVREVPDYYEDGETALRMERELVPAADATAARRSAPPRLRLSL